MLKKDITCPYVLMLQFELKGISVLILNINHYFYYPCFFYLFYRTFEGEVFKSWQCLLFIKTGHLRNAECVDPEA